MNHFYEHELEDGTLVLIEYSRSPYDPGVSYGPAETCYPPEGGEVEILKITYEVDGKDIPYPATDEQAEQWYEMISNFQIEDDYDGWDEIDGV